MLSVGILEAISCGCPLLVGDTEAAREVIQHGETGFLYRDAQSSALADTITDMLKNISGLERLRVAQRKKVQSEYSVQRIMDSQIRYILKRYLQWKMEPLPG
jgi:putative glycosyltransferase